MAIYHCQAKSISRAKGRSATAAAAYRAGDTITDERTGERHDYTRKKGVEHTEIIFPCNVASLSRSELWNTAEQAERRKDAKIAREWELALPVELSKQQRIELATNFAHALVDRYGVAADVCLHLPGTTGDQRNYHAHILTTTRSIKSDGTMGEKTRILDSPRTSGNEVTAMRQLWADMANTALEQAGFETNIDHRSLIDQGIYDRIPQIHVGPVANSLEAKGVKTERKAECESRKKINAELSSLTEQIATLVAKQAGETWEVERHRRAEVALENQQKQKVFENGKSERECTESRYSERTFGERNFRDGKRIDCSIARDVSENAVRELRAGSRKLDTGQRPGNLPNLLQGATHDSGRPTDEVQRNGEAGTAADSRELKKPGLLGDEEQERKRQMVLAETETRQEAEVRVKTESKPLRPAVEKTRLYVHYEEMEEAKALGARWDKIEKIWYAPADTDLAPLQEFLKPKEKYSAEYMKKKKPVVEAPAPVLNQASEQEQASAQQRAKPVKPEPLLMERKQEKLGPAEEFGVHLKRSGLVLDGPPVADGQVHKVPVVGDPEGKTSGRYCLYGDTQALNGYAGNYSNYREAQLNVQWQATGLLMSDAERNQQSAANELVKEKLRQREASKIQKQPQEKAKEETQDFER